MRVAGVNVGTVSRVIARPDRKDCPAETELAISTSYELVIPEDAVAEIGSHGVLGSSFVGIDARQAYGPPIKNHGTLKSVPPVTIDWEKVLERVLNRDTKGAEEPPKKRPRAAAK